MNILERCFNEIITVLKTEQFTKRDMKFIHTMCNALLKMTDKLLNKNIK